MTIHAAALLAVPLTRALKAGRHGRQAVLLDPAADAAQQREAARVLRRGGSAGHL
ncbi:hypothetical protein ACIBLB_29755 [Streptosporangium canum]|uniref:hypothetical protein n=1 Tax=Streptosporangium canum TaxID=324952 RepID=UPI0037916275